MPKENADRLVSASLTSLRQSRDCFSRLWDILALVFLGLFAWFYWQLADNTQLGFTHDDGVYAVAGKAFAEGKGLTLLHVVGQPSEVKYPFLFPFLLAPVWFFQPHFPQNLPALNAVSGALTLAGCVVLYIYLTRSQRMPGWLALLIMALVVSNFFFMYFATLVMSEGAYLFFSFLTLWYAHRQMKQGGRWTFPTVLTVMLLSLLTFHTRILGLALMAAIGIWLLLQKQWRNALIYGAGCFLGGVLPWALWVRFRTPAVNDLTYPLVNTYSNYGLEFVHNYVGGNYFDALGSDFFGLIVRLLESMIPIIPNLFKVYPALKAYPSIVTAQGISALIAMYLLFGYFVLQVVQTGFRAFRNRRFHADAFSIPALYLVIYLVIITLWNYEDQLTRFLLVVTPLLWLYFFKPLLAALRSYRSEIEENIPIPASVEAPSAHPLGKAPIWRPASAAAIILLVSILSLWTAPSSYRMISSARQQHWVVTGPARYWLWSEYQHSFAWIRQNLPEQAPLAAASDVVYYLYTDHPTYYVFYASLKKHRGYYTRDAIPVLMRSMDHYGVRYLVVEPHMQARTIRAPRNRIAADLLKQFPRRFQLAYTSPRQAILIYRIVPVNAS